MTYRITLEVQADNEDEALENAVYYINAGLEHRVLVSIEEVEE